MVSALVASLIHSAVLSGAIYASAGSSLAMTMLVVAVTLVLLNVITKRVLGATGVTTTVWETVVGAVASLIPIALIWQKFGGVGFLAYIGTVLLTSLATMYI